MLQKCCELPQEGLYSVIQVAHNILTRPKLQKCPKNPTNGLYVCSKDAHVKDSQKCKLLCRKNLTPNRKGTKCLDLNNDPYHCGAVSSLNIMRSLCWRLTCRSCRRVISVHTRTMATAREFVTTGFVLAVSAKEKRTTRHIFR